MAEKKEVLRPQIVDMAEEQITYVDGVAYTVQEDGPYRLDAFWDDAAPRPMPAIIWIHGGGFTEEHVTRKSRPEKSFLELARKGFFIASIDYRLAQVKPFPAQIEDAKCAVRYLRSHADKWEIDPDRIGVWGESCGGQLAGLMAVQEGIPDFEDKGGWPSVPSTVQAAVSWYGGFDILAFENMLKDERFLIMYGGSAEEKRDLVIKASPITYADKKLCPFLAMCSNTDPRVPDVQSAAFCEKASKHGNDAGFMMVPGQGHGYFEGDEYYQKIYAFFEKHLKQS